MNEIRTARREVFAGAGSSQALVHAFQRWDLEIGAEVGN